jgi:hypothetical protein
MPLSEKALTDRLRRSIEKNMEQAQRLRRLEKENAEMKKRLWELGEEA